MARDTLDMPESYVNSKLSIQSDDSKLSPLDLGGYEIDIPARDRLPKDTDLNASMADILASDMPLQGKALVLLTGFYQVQGLPTAFSRKTLMTLLSLSNGSADNAAALVEKHPHVTVEKPSRRTPYRYRIMSPVLHAESSEYPISCVTRAKTPITPSTRPGRPLDPEYPTTSCTEYPTTSCTPIGSRGVEDDEVNGDGESPSFSGETATTNKFSPNELGDNQTHLTPAEPLPPALINPPSEPAISYTPQTREVAVASEHTQVRDAGSGVLVDGDTIKGPGFVISLRAAELQAGMLGVPLEHARMIAEGEALSWATSGFRPAQPDKVVASAIRKHIPQVAEVRAQVAAVQEAQGVNKWRDRLTAGTNQNPAPAASQAPRNEPLIVDGRFNPNYTRPVRTPFSLFISTEQAQEIADEAKATPEAVVDVLKTVENLMPAQRTSGGKYAVTSQEVINWCVMQLWSVDLQATPETIKAAFTIAESARGGAIITIDEKYCRLFGNLEWIVIIRCIRYWEETKKIGYLPAKELFDNDPIKFFNILKREVNNGIMHHQ